MQYKRGFTLMEVMVTVTVIGVIVAIGFPAYNSHMLKTRRAAASACVVEFAQFMERNYTTSMSYSTDQDGEATELPDSNCRIDLTPFYAFSLEATVQTYLLTASPIGQQGKDTSCGVLTLDQAGFRTAAGSDVPEKIRECF